MNSEHYSYSKKMVNTKFSIIKEKCGLVDYLFSDKTGALTYNKMEFKYCVIGDICYQYMRGNPEENYEK